MEEPHCFLCVDLKSYYASVECAARGLDPLRTNLVVSDESRTTRTICLAVSPTLKAYGISGRARLFEVVQRVREINSRRLERAPGRLFWGRSYDDPTLREDPSLELDYIIAPPRMQLYLDTSAKIYGIYLRYVAEEDIHVYSVDEAFLDITRYMKPRGLKPRQFAQAIMADVLRETGITATCGIGTNLYLAKIALDILSKHRADRIGILTEERYRRLLWDHRPLTDFWMVSQGTVSRLSHLGLETMGDVAGADEKQLYRAFGVNAQLLIDHAWGRESCSMADIKAYRPKERSLSSGQVLHEGYDIPGARLLILEMAELLSLELVEKGLSTRSVTITLAYSHSAGLRPATGSMDLGCRTSSTALILESTAALYDRVARLDIPVYHLGLCFNRVREEDCWQYHLFSDPERQERERLLQRAIVDIKRKYGKNGIFKGMNLLEGAKTLERNAQIGGHRAG